MKFRHNRGITLTEWLIVAVIIGLMAAVVIPVIHMVQATSRTPQSKVGSPQKIQVYFSPNGGTTKAIVAAIDKAESSILVQAYYITSKPIIDAIISAKQRKVDVKVIADKVNFDNNKGEYTKYVVQIFQSGVPVFIDGKHPIAHSKIIIIDKSIVITGSFNFTSSAENRNAENTLIINDPGLAKAYIDNWNNHSKHSETLGVENGFDNLRGN